MRTLVSTHKAKLEKPNQSVSSQLSHINISFFTYIKMLEQEHKYLKTSKNNGYTLGIHHVFVTVRGRCLDEVESNHTCIDNLIFLGNVVFTVGQKRSEE
mmetsp:Transcript_20664/g.29164  ORF Transcript_20664/g.29164 Transcript_20664/m.29164 type:complete len:99 (+) Transcript_20664:74-370(+)